MLLKCLVISLKLQAKLSQRLPALYSDYVFKFFSQRGRSIQSIHDVAGHCMNYVRSQDVQISAIPPFELRDFAIIFGTGGGGTKGGEHREKITTKERGARCKTIYIRRGRSHYFIHSLS